MGRTDLVVAVGAREQDVPRIGIGQNMGQQGQRRRIDPLQVVHDHAQQLIARRKRLQQVRKHTVEAVARLDRRQGGNRRLRAGDQLQFGNNIDDDPGVVADGRQDARPPGVELILALARAADR